MKDAKGHGSDSRGGVAHQSGIGKIGYNSTINEAELDRFKSQWPAHGLPDNLASLGFSFDSKGDLNDIDARTHEGKSLDSSDFDGPALVALSEDAQRKVNPGHADDRFGKRGN